MRKCGLCTLHRTLRRKVSVSPLQWGGGEIYQRKESKTEEKEGKERDQVSKTGWWEGKESTRCSPLPTPSPKPQEVSGRNFPLTKAKGMSNPTEPPCVLINAGWTSAGPLEQSHLNSQFNLQKDSLLIKNCANLSEGFFFFWKNRTYFLRLTTPNKFHNCKTNGHVNLWTSDSLYDKDVI